MNRKLLFPAVGLLIAIAVLLPTAHWSTNCGGNSAALPRVHEIAFTAAVSISDTPDHTFRFTTANEEERKELACCAHSVWLPRAHFLVSLAPISTGQPKHIIVICDTPYRNVPRRWIGSASPAHAAGYSDGSYGLISPAEFAAIDRSTFVPLDRLYPSKSE